MRLTRRKTGLSPPVKYFTDRSKAVLFCGSFMFFSALRLLCFRACLLYVPCGHLLGKGWTIGSRLWCLTVSLSLSHWYFWVRCGTWLYRFLTFAPLLTLLICYTAYLSCWPHGFREFFQIFNTSLCEQKSPGHGQFIPQGHGWQDLGRGSLNIDIYVIYKLWASWFRVYFFQTIVNGGSWHPWCSQFGLHGHGWQDLCRGPLDILHYIKYISCGPELQWLEIWCLIHLSLYVYGIFMLPMGHGN